MSTPQLITVSKLEERIEDLKAFILNHRPDLHLEVTALFVARKCNMLSLDNFDDILESGFTGLSEYILACKMFPKRNWLARTTNYIKTHDFEEIKNEFGDLLSEAIQIQNTTLLSYFYDFVVENYDFFIGKRVRITRLYEMIVDAVSEEIKLLKFAVLSFADTYKVKLDYDFFKSVMSLEADEAKLSYIEFVLEGNSRSLILHETMFDLLGKKPVDVKIARLLCNYMRPNEFIGFNIKRILKTNDLETIQMFLDRGASITRECISAAIKLCDDEIVEYLIDQSLISDQRLFVYLMIYQGKNNLFKKYIGNVEPEIYDFLIEAAMFAQNFEIFKWFTENTPGFDYDRYFKIASNLPKDKVKFMNYIYSKLIAKK